MSDTDVIDNFIFFFSFIFVSELLLFAYVYKKTNGKPMTYFKKEGKGAIFGLVMALFAPAIIALVLSVIAYGSKAEADEITWRYLDHIDIVAGLEVPVMGGASNVCENNGVNDKLTSNLAAYQQLVGKGDVDIYAHYIHHSCAINIDKPTYDSVGVSLHWRINWKK